MIEFRYWSISKFYFIGVKLLEKWFIKNRKGNIEKTMNAHGISKFLSKLLINRGINDYNLIQSYLSPEFDKLNPPQMMKDMDKGVNIIRNNILNKEKIRIVGDYDVDGVISIYNLYKGMKRCGGDVDYVVPDRVEDGYGINEEIVKKAKFDGIYTIITCDNGIAAIEAVELAKELGMAVIITDHHDLPFTKNLDGKIEYIHTMADAVINPKQEECRYPFKLLCGAGITFKFIEDLYSKFNISREEAYKLIEYTAIATVCDVVDLIDENRIIVKKGLELLNKTENVGLKALIRESGIEGKEISVYHLGFVIGPSINASGRLESALLAIELLLSEDEDEANELAKKLRILNDERKNMTNSGVEKIIEVIENSPIKDDKVLVVYESSIHESIAGIIAGRVKDKLNKPTIVLTDAKDGVKGSGRSIKEYNMFEELSKCKDLLNRFGGHPMAAGLSLDLSKIDNLRKRLNDLTELTEEDLISKKYIDMQLPLDYISFKLMDELSILEPFGKGNNKPLFGDKNIRVKKGTILGKNKNVLKLVLESKNKKNMEGLFFGDIKSFENSVRKAHGDSGLDNLYRGIDSRVDLDILYYPSINEFRGNTNLQVIIQNFRVGKQSNN